MHDLSVSADFFSGNSPACINCYEKENKTITYQKQEYRTHDNVSVVSVGWYLVAKKQISGTYTLDWNS